MNRIPVGYQVKIRRKRPKVVILFLFFFVSGLSFFLIRPNFDKVKTFFSKSDRIVDSVKVSDKILVNLQEKIKEDVFEKSISNNNEKQNTENPIQFKPINDIEQTQKNLKTNIPNPVTIENIESVSPEQSNVFDENESEEFVPKEVEEENKELDTLNLLSEKQGNTTVLIKDTLKSIEYKYYVIVGSVKTKEEAKLQQKKYLSMAENTDIIFESSINRYRISLGTYSGFKQASVKSKAFHAKHPNYKTWIWKTIPVTEE